MTAVDRYWRYSAENPSGAVISGSIAAPDADAAYSLLASRRLLPLSLKQDRLWRMGRFGRSGAASLTVSELAQISQRLSDLFAAGIPLAHALRLSGEQAQNVREKRFLTQLLGEARSGHALGEALTRNEFKVPRLFKALVEAGESLGSLDSQMQRLAAHYEETLKLRREIIGQLIYPFALVILIIATLLFLSFLILPQFEAIFQSARATPPAETRLVLAAGGIVRGYWWTAPIMFAAVALSVRFFGKKFSRKIERARLATPLAGRILLNAEVGRYLRTLATLLEGGAPLAKAMPLARETLSLELLREQFLNAENAVRVGERLAAACRRLTSMPAEFASFLEIGEETGELARLATQGAARAETLVHTSIKQSMALLAPGLTALMGLLTAGVIAAVMTGVLSLNEAVF